MLKLFTSIQLAITYHDGQKRRYYGFPYVIHPIRVAAILHKWCLGTDEQITGVLHDIVEDTGCTQSDLREAGFSTNVQRWVEQLTNSGKTWEERKQNIIDKALGYDLPAFIVKCADRIDNINDLSMEIQQTGGSCGRASLDQEVWYAEEFLKIARRRIENAFILRDLDITVKFLKEMVVEHGS